MNIPRCWGRRAAVFSAAMAFAVVLAAGAQAETRLTWHDDYGQAMQQAQEQRKMLLVYFHTPLAAEDTAEQSAEDTAGHAGSTAQSAPADRTTGELQQAFEQQTLHDHAVRELLACFVLCKLPTDAAITSDGEIQRLLRHPGFRDLNGQAGIAVVDFVHHETDRYRRVVSAIPLVAGVPLGSRELQATLRAQLPASHVVPRDPRPLVWHTDYGLAMQIAEQHNKNLLIYFHAPTGDDPIGEAFEQQTLSDPRIQAKLRPYVLAALPVDATITVDGAPVRLIDHPSFRYMYSRQGFAIVDLVHRDTEHYKQVISAFPFSQRRQYDVRKMSVILGLPPGTITQRTLIYAVRIHREAPASTNGILHRLLAREAQRHSAHQARINLQGHHDWSSRFHQITNRLPDGLLAVEVCAESWPGEELVDAAIECVHSWRQSSGHWNAVQAGHPMFGYDMKLGSNRIWYATGIFAKRRD